MTTVVVGLELEYKSSDRTQGYRQHYVPVTLPTVPSWGIRIQFANIYTKTSEFVQISWHGKQCQGVRVSLLSRSRDCHVVALLQRSMSPPCDTNLSQPNLPSIRRAPRRKGFIHLSCGDLYNRCRRSTGKKCGLCGKRV